MAVSGGFGRAAGRISFDNKDLADIGIAAFTVGQFAVGVKGEFLLGQQVGTGLSSVLRILAAFSAQESTTFKVSRFLSK